MSQTYENLVGGEWIGPIGDGDNRFERLNPANTDESVGTYPALGDADAERIFEAAREGLAEWRSMRLLDRGRVLLQAASLIRERGAQIAEDLTREMGKTLAEAKAETSAAAAFFEYNGGLARAPEGEVLADRRDQAMVWTKREPIGVVVLITPWNDPLATPARKLGPALICGNAVVIKPASYTPLSALHLARALHDAGVPPGAVNTATGSGSTIGSALARLPGVAGVSFTGSNEVGAQLQARAAGTSLRLQTELGGKNAALVLRDADLDVAIDAISSAAWGQTGQRCTSTSRVIVEEPLIDEVVDRLVKRAESLQVGSGLDSRVEMGPLVSPEQLDSVVSAVAESRSQGAELIVGGDRLVDEDHRRGHFMAPTILSVGDSTNVAWVEELFGPVLAVRSASTLQEGLELVNQTRFGLSAAVFTTDLRHANSFAREIEAGQISINVPTAGWDVHVPFGGFKDSGSAFREQGTEGLAFYSRMKSIAMFSG
jgi:acyl-CoA reductase-like NAD-dependent aldehyde dehydrogenase